MSAMIQKEHPEGEKENSLTAPLDRDRENRWRPEQGARALTEDEVKDAVSTLENVDFVSKFPRVDRTYADPQIPLQAIGLVSFTPAKGASPNENGVFGFAKLRGNYATSLEANQRAEEIIRNIDSYHQIYHTYVGRPFPITASSKYSAETSEIDIRRDMTSSVSGAIKAKKKDDRNEIEDIKRREEKLLAESRQDPEDVDPYEEYITLRVKKAQLYWTYLEHHKKIKEVKDLIIQTRIDVAELDAKNPEFDKNYYQKYVKAREDVGLKIDKEEMATNFMQFLVEDEVLPGIDDVDDEEKS